MWREHGPGQRAAPGGEGRRGVSCRPVCPPARRHIAIRSAHLVTRWPAAPSLPRSEAAKPPGVALPWTLSLSPHPARMGGPVQYDRIFVAGTEVPQAARPLFQHLLDTYASETNKTAAVWSELRDDQLEFRVHARSGSVREILAHQILSEPRFFSEFIGLTEPPPATPLPTGERPGVAAYRTRYLELAAARFPALAAGDEAFWLAAVPFFDVTRERIWVFWRRLLHTAH